MQLGLTGKHDVLFTCFTRVDDCNVISSLEVASLVTNFFKIRWYAFAGEGWYCGGYCTYMCIYGECFNALVCVCVGCVCTHVRLLACICIKRPEELIRRVIQTQNLQSTRSRLIRQANFLGLFRQDLNLQFPQRNLNTLHLSFVQTLSPSLSTVVAACAPQHIPCARLRFLFLKAMEA